MNLGQLHQTKDGSYTLIHPEHGEAYHSHCGALLEADSLYIKSSDIESYWQNSTQICRVLDVGLGLGYNLIATAAAWLNASPLCHLEIYSLEINPALIEAFCSAKASWQINWQPEWLELLNASVHWREGLKFSHPKDPQKQLRVRFICGDFTKDRFESELEGPVQFIWQDPFSPEKNPLMWSKEWFERVKSVSSSGAVLMTYSVAGGIRRALSEAGFSWNKIPTASRKKAWLRAQLEN